MWGGKPPLATVASATGSAFYGGRFRAVGHRVLWVPPAYTIRCNSPVVGGPRRADYCCVPLGCRRIFSFVSCLHLSARLLLSFLTRDIDALDVVSAAPPFATVKATESSRPHPNVSSQV